MKKHLLAAAVATAIAAPAMAQNVTVTGVLDVGYGSIKQNGTNRTSVVGGALATPTLTIKGVEDLGQGASVEFNLSQEFRTQDGVETGSAGGSTNTTAQYINGGTAAATSETEFEEVSLKYSASFGSIKLGHFNMTSRDNAGVYRFAGEWARLSSNFRSLGSKTDNTVEYASPSFQGFDFTLSRADAGKDYNVDAGTRVTGASAGYKNGPLQVRVSQTSSKAQADARSNTERMIGGTYDLGTFKVGVLSASETSTADVKSSAQVFNVAYPMGSGLTLHGSVHNYGGDTTAYEANGYAVAVTKDLSKRTSVYAGYMALKNDTGTVPMSVIANGTANTTNSAAAVGFVHKF